MNCDYLPGVYALLHTDGTVKYIGVGKCAILRSKSHWKRFLKKRTAVNSRLKNWFQTLSSRPEAKILENCQSFKLALEREKFWIKTFWAYEEAYCNIHPGGGSGDSFQRHPTSVGLRTRQKISSSLLGHEVSAESRMKMRAAKLGKRLSLEHRQKIGLGNKGKIVPIQVRRKISSSLQGHEVSLEIRKKISETKLSFSKEEKLG